MSADNISDELLTAYLDGELSGGDLTRVERALAASPDLQTRLADLDVPLEHFREGLAPLLDQAPRDLVKTLPEPARRFPVWIAGGSLAAGLALGALLTLQFAAPQKSPGWIDYVASYQALYSKDTLYNVRPSPEAMAHQFSQISAKIGRPLQTAQDVPGLLFKNAQILGFQGKPLIQMAYLSTNGVPVALCIIAKEETASLRQMELEGLQSAMWSDGTHAYLLIGGQDADFIETTAQHLQLTL